VAAHVQFEEWVSFPSERVFLFFANPNNLPRIMPPATGTRIDQLKLVAPPPPPSASKTPSTSLAGVGSEIFTSFLVLPPLPFRATWIALITEFAWNHHFSDIQRKGPFRRWQHRHEFFAEIRRGVTGTLVRDVIEYEAGFGIVGTLAEKLFISGQMRRTFAHRQEALGSLLSDATL
jgi:ligand-binding SRPBCC domain-containing protein